MKKILALLTTLIILMIPLYINAYELEAENGEYEYSSTIPETGYDYSHTICNGSRLKDDKIFFNESTNTITIKEIIEQSNCKFYFNRNGEEITKNYEVKIEVKNGKTNEESKVVQEGENVEFTLTNNTGYSNPKVTCTNNQTGTIQNNTLRITNVTNNTTCTVEYNANTYEVKYNSNGGNGAMANSSHTYGTSKALSTNTFTRSGYTFQGWSTSNSSNIVTYTNGQNVINLTTENGGVVNLYAVWSINSYTVNVVVQNGTITGDTSKETDYNTNVTFTLNPNNGYGNPTVSCTNSQKGSISGSTLTVSNVTNDTTCTVTYKENEYSIEYNLNGGRVTSNPDSYTVNSDTITLKNPTKTGYTFTGWTGSNGSTAQTTVTIPKGSTGNKSYTANYRINTYTVNATVTNGTITGSTSKTVNHGSSTTFTINPSSGYGNPTVSCTNSQSASINGSTLTVSNVASNTTCTVSYTSIIASEVIMSKATEGNNEGLIKLDQPATGQTPAQTEYRYSGSNDVVKNYVNFNNETWRIIGVFPTDDGRGNYEDRLKIVREESIGNYSWDTIAKDIGINQWGSSSSYEGADLMRLLNPGHENKSINNSLYWNRRSGTCYNGYNNATTTCNFTSTGLTDEAKNMIGDTKWYTSASDSAGKRTIASEFYVNERENTTTQFTSPTRLTNWVGKVGLLYPSDYGYASSGCRDGQKSLDRYNNTVCSSTNWLFKNAERWLISPSADYRMRAFYSNDSGSVYDAGTSADNSVYPVIYLKSSVKITSGTGTESDPYELSL